MNRTIKFRAWTGKTMMYQEKQYLESFLRRVVMQVTIDHDFPETYEHESYLPKGTVIDDYLLQFTGLLDKNGKEIYEGDTVKRDNYPRPFTVVWDKDGYWLQDTEVENSTLLGVDNEHCEVIGNIHETQAEEA